MANKTKYSKTLIAEILSELATGKSIRSCLSPINKNPDRPCWETFRSWMRDTKKYPNLRQDYENSKIDGIEYLLSDAQDLLNSSIEASKFKEKTDLGQTHLIKSFVDLSKWKSERIAPKYYAKRDATTLNFDKNTPLVVKWDK
ncbi:DNA binding protein [uncultured Mediterranean phage uvMED]|nr:DNA binding protein [uncultured Mediterranean phage uvMED]